ncbi:serine/threonine protein kinase [Parasphingorhabdus halotolerans]|uniref:Serine/threonine protein kinase n=1 Tax=Parasphingorhabdus halotolerans TaxID=2725558 RepID=A0A6H2DL71_9SPHN|nr:serine/threonine-protein kinase [Parasphingorhabdus halotolerans]QJB68948.1 serine/threonine protein kinase [Parasphingorhabdus halotolerans]
MTETLSSIELAAMELFELAMERSQEDREDFISGVPEASELVKLRALKLLLVDRTAFQSLKTGGAAELDEEDEPQPETIGAYRILHLLGRGGMGAVYLAERMASDFDQIVAIKVIKKRLINPEIVERFRRERQILADLNHPHIARLFDGGETDEGAPYFVMEFVDGQPLDEWRITANPSVDDLLKIFVSICEAVEFAHQHLIIHRDITPANILVGEGGYPKLIDFGIARVGIEEDDPTEQSSLSFTPGYAAPERKYDGAANVLTDIYSLGKLFDMLIAGNREPELRAIADKAASINSADRYQGATAMLGDISDFIENKPISAFASSPLYIGKKFVQRQKLAVGAGAILIIGVLLSLIIVTLAYRQVEASRAETEQRFADTRDIANTMMFDVFDEVSMVPGNTAARLLIVQNAQKYLEALAAEPDSSMDIRLAAGRGYSRLAEVTGSLASGNIGELEKGLALYERAAELLEGIYEAKPDDEVRLALAEVHKNLARDKLLTFVDTETAQIHAKKAIALVQEIRTPSSESYAVLGQSYRFLADGLACCGSDAAGGQRAIKSGIQAINKAPEQVRETLPVQRALNDLQNLQAGLYSFNGKTNLALREFEKAYRDQMALIDFYGENPEDRRLLATIATNYARTLLMSGQQDQAERIIGPAYGELVVASKSDELDYDLNRSVSIVSLLRAEVALARKQNNDAEKYFEQGLRAALISEDVDEVDQGNSMDFAFRLNEAARVASSLGKTAQACDLTSQSLRIMRRYLQRFKLPETTKKYRFEPMVKNMRRCR